MKVLLPDNSQLELPDGATGLDAARAIGATLAEQAVLVRADGSVQDLRLPRSPSAELAADQGLQAAGARGRLLARRRVLETTDSHLRHRVLDAGRPRRSPLAAGAGARPGSPAHRATTRSVPSLGALA